MGALSRLLGSLGTVLALALVAQPCTAQFTVLDNVRISTEYPWPPELGKGYFPLRVLLENESDDERTLDIRALRQSFRDGAKGSERTVTLGPGETRTVEMYASVFKLAADPWSSNYSLQVWRRGRQVRLNGQVNSANWVPELRNLVFVTEARIDASTSEQIDLRLKTDDLKAGRRFSGSSGPKSTRPNVLSSVIPASLLPGSYQAYTSLDAVVIDARDGLPPNDVLEPIATWVRVGGRAVFLGDDVAAQLERVPSLAGAFEPRFELERLDGGTIFAHGLGLFVLGGGDEGLIESSRDRALVRAALWPERRAARQTNWVPVLDTSVVRAIPIMIPGVGELPLRVFLVLLLAFAVVIGPWNFMVIKKLARPGMLLLTVPLLSLVASIGILIYGVFSQGIEIKTASQSLTVLDQRTHRAATVEQRALFVGLSTAPGLRPEAGTTVLPDPYNKEVNRFRIDFTDGVLLMDDYLPTRDPVGQTLLTEAAGRGRISFRRAGARVVIQNGLSARIEKLSLRDEEGVWYAADGGVEPGAEASLQRAARPPSNGGRDDETRGDDVGSSVVAAGCFLPLSSYVAILDKNPFTDACGIEPSEKIGQHSLIGILAARSEDWE